MRSDPAANAAPDSKDDRIDVSDIAEGLTKHNAARPDKPKRGLFIQEDKTTSLASIVDGQLVEWIDSPDEDDIHAVLGVTPPEVKDAQSPTGLPGYQGDTTMEPVTE